MLTIPNRFLEILNTSPNLQGIVIKTVHDFSKIIANSEFEFFPDYTDHRIDHLNRVLETCEFIIEEQTYSHISAEDITVLISSVLLHDIGMHITHEGLMSLFESENKINNFDKFVWSDVWEEYFQKVKKMSEKNLMSTFGSKEVIRTLPLDKDKLTRLDRKVYGEFIRKYHPRMAHEIAVFGFPTKSDNIPFAFGLDSDIKEIIGLVARSHGMNLRGTFDYLEKKFGKVWRTPRNVKIIFLMTVLRIADYLHITSERAPIITLNTKKISSTISKKEWELHNCIKEISYNILDPECVYVVAAPPNSELFLKVQNLLMSIQKELDTSWGVLGEVYGSLADFKNLKMKLRRIQSNLDDMDQFSEGVSYLPQKISCESDSELSKLLIAPLYGNNPSYGVRELLQNSIDACNERRILINTRGVEEEYTPQIKITIEETDDGGGFFSILDNGIGMTENIIINYFLKAGATFRNSDQWKRNFIDAENNTTVQRSGRFGVGVFAGFLIGNEMDIKTKNIESETAYEFVVSMDQEQIEVTKTKGVIGTVITIKVVKEIMEQLKDQLATKGRASTIPWFKWFCINDIQISIHVPSTWGLKSLSDSINYIDVTQKDIHTIFPEGFNEVKWTYNYTRDYLPNLICNGIIIPRGYHIRSFDFPKIAIDPLILVSDNAGNLPLTLNRNEVYGVLSFEEELFIDISKDLNACLLMSKVLDFDSNGNFSVINHRIDHPCLKERYSWPRSIKQEELLLFKEGFCLFHSYNILNLNINKISRVWMNDLDNSFINTEDQLKGIILSDEKLNAIADYKNILDIDRIGTDKKFQIESKRIVITKEKYNYLMERDRLRSGFKKELQLEREGEFLISLVQGNPPTAELEFDLLESNNKNVSLYVEYYINGKVVSEPYYNANQTNLKDTYVSVAEELYGGNVLIPYNYKDRVRKFKLLFINLSVYIEKYKLTNR
ncbi:MAG: ATPase domain protein [Bacillales bacterium]|jgi:hypothetical protein|nr:ATPase domain protein [Bacillales bacterium]